jgi:hypothetical protein
LGYPDPEQLDYGASLGLCVVTHNREDFEELHRQYLAADRDHAGIVIAIRKRPYEVWARLREVLNTLTADEMRNQLLYI